MIRRHILLIFENELLIRYQIQEMLRFELSPSMVAAAKGGAALSLGIDHAACEVGTGTLPDAVHASLVADLA